MNHGLRQSQDNIGFRQLCNQKENEDKFALFLVAIVDNVPYRRACRNGFGACSEQNFLWLICRFGGGMRLFVEEWEKVAASLLKGLRREAVGQVADTELQS